jgi:hypothetical protein
MRTGSATVLAVYFGLTTGWVAWSQTGLAAGLQRLDGAAASQCLGGACPNVGCKDKTCGLTDTDSSCFTRSPTGFLCRPPLIPRGNTKCMQLVANAFARCGDLNSETGKTCTESSNGGCITQKSGDQEADKTCKDTACSADAGSCGPTSYICTATACE